MSVSVCVIEPLVAVTVIVHFPAVAVDGTDTVWVAVTELVPVIEALVVDHLPVRFDGRPSAARLTVPLNPPFGATVIL